jgi:DNA primase catalytic core
MQTTPTGTTTVAPTYSTAVSFPQAAELVKAQLDIVQIISRYVPTLKKRGRNHLGLCPFHNEKSPSFNVHAEKGLFKCFGCNEGGDALAFLMKIERKTYAELIEERAADMGLTIIRDHQQEARYAQTLAERDQILALNEAACRWFESLIQSGEGTSTQTYLTVRGYDLGWLKPYRVGLAANAWDRLTTYLLQQFDFAQADPTVLERAGLSAPRQKDGQAVEGGGYYDRFRHRLIIPILGAKNEVLGFGGRTLDPDGQPKYLNSPETALYVKSKVLYGLPQARPAIMAEKRAFLMEGYFDVLAAHKAGAMASVATCGTALTLDHVRQLVRLGVETLYCCFDNDTAGRQATLRAIDTVNQATLAGGTAPKVRVLNLPGGKDPDDYFKQATLADFEVQVTQAPDALSYQLDSQLEGLALNDLDARLEAAGRITPLLAKVANAVVQSEYTRRYAQRLSIAPEALMAEVTRAAKQVSEAQQQAGQGFKNFNAKQATFDLQGSFNRRDPHLSAQAPSVDHWSSSSSPLSVGGYSVKPWTPGTGGKGRGFGKKAPPPRPDNFVELRQRLGTRHLLAEATLASLLFVSPVALESISPLLTTLSWQTPSLGDLCARWMALLAGEPAEAKALPVGPALEPWLKHWVDRLMSEVADLPLLRQTLTACVFEAETITRIEQLDTLSPEAQRQRLSQRAATCIQAIRLHQRHDRLKQMKQAIEQIEKSSHNRSHWPDMDDLADSAIVAPTLAAPDEETQSANLLELHYQLKRALAPTALVADEVAALPAVSPAHSVLSAGPPQPPPASLVAHGQLPALGPVLPSQSPVSVLPDDPAALKTPPDHTGWMEGPST